MSNIDALFSNVSVEWHTPEIYLDAAARVLKGIELDPASCASANERVKAERFFTAADDGLNQSWKARSIWLNPPYGKRDGKSQQAVWSKKLVDEYEAGGVFGSAILLVNASTSERWFKPLWNYPICFTDKRIKFIGVDAKSMPTKGNAFVYLGTDWKGFADEFNNFGTVAVRWQP